MGGQLGGGGGGQADHAAARSAAADLERAERAWSRCPVVEVPAVEVAAPYASPGIM